MGIFLSVWASEWLISFRTFLQNHYQKHTHTLKLFKCHLNTATGKAKGKKMMFKKSRGCIFCFFGTILQDCVHFMHVIRSPSEEKIKRYTRRNAKTISLLPEFIKLSLYNIHLMISRLFFSKREAVPT